MPTTLVTNYNDNLVSEEVQEIVSRRPHWMVRRGNAIFFAVFAGLLSVTWFVKYPDVLPATGRLVAMNPPLPVSVKSGNRLQKLFVRDEQEVKVGQHLGYMQGTASYDEVMQLQAWVIATIKNTSGGDYSSLVKSPLTLLNELGPLQPDYESFKTVSSQAEYLMAGGYFEKRQSALQADIAQIGQLQKVGKDQLDLVEQDRKLQEKELAAYRKLAAEKVIAPLELNAYESKMLGKEGAIKQLSAQMTNAQMSSTAKRTELLELMKVKGEQQAAFSAALLNLKSKIDTWIDANVLVAPTSGKVQFTQRVTEGTTVQAGQTLFFIQPQQTAYYAEVMAAQTGFGKVEKGQEVQLKVLSYPVEEFGFLKGRIEHLTALPSRQDSFLLTVTLPQGLKTNFGKDLSFRNGLASNASIIVKERRLAERFLNELIKLTKR